MTNTIETKKTYKGKTAGGWLKLANIGKSKAGMDYVWIGNYQAMLDQDDDLVLMDYYGHVATLYCAGRALKKMRSLCRKVYGDI